MVTAFGSRNQALWKVTEESLVGLQRYPPAKGAVSTKDFGLRGNNGASPSMENEELCVGDKVCADDETPTEVLVSTPGQQPRWIPTGRFRFSRPRVFTARSGGPQEIVAAW